MQLDRISGASPTRGAGAVQGSAGDPDPTWWDLLFPGLSKVKVTVLSVVIAFGAGVLWYSPVSPAALGHADALAGLGRATDAVAAYDAIADHHPSAAVREEALFRAATVVATDLSDPGDARERFRKVTRVDGRHQAEAWEAIGHLQLSNERRPALAARAFERAWQVDPDAPRAAERLASAARARAEAGQVDQSAALWRDLARRYPDRTAQSAFERATLRLASGDAQEALALYETAESAATEPVLQGAAHVGAATCLERLGDLEEALAAIDGSDLPDDVRVRRVEGILARRSLSGM